MITDFWDGGDLYEYMGNHPKFTEKHLAEVLKQLFSILKYIHEKKIVHRDIKSENILVKDTEDGILIKLIDWGMYPPPPYLAPPLARLPSLSPRPSGRPTTWRQKSSSRPTTTAPTSGVPACSSTRWS